MINFNKNSGSLRRNLGHNMSKEVKLRHHKRDLTAKPALLFGSHVYILRHKNKRFYWQGTFAGHTLRDRVSTEVVTESFGVGAGHGSRAV
jgi:hypothetical protein